MSDQTFSVLLLLVDVALAWSWAIPAIALIVLVGSRDKGKHTEQGAGS